jgi:hypothetical protein
MELRLNHGTTLPLLLSLYVILSFKWVMSVGFAPFVVSDTEHSCEVTFCFISYPISNKAFRNANCRSTLEQVVQPLSHPEKELMLTNPMAHTDCPDFPWYSEIIDYFMWTANVSYQNRNLHMYTVEACSHRKKTIPHMNENEQSPQYELQCFVWFLKADGSSPHFTYQRCLLPVLSCLHSSPPSAFSSHVRPLWQSGLECRPHAGIMGPNPSWNANILWIYAYFYLSGADHSGCPV